MDGARGHAHRQRHVAFRQIRHDIGAGAAGTRAYEDHAYGQLGRQLEHHRQQERQHRHDNELRQDAHDDSFRLREHHLEVGQLEGHAHAEHTTPSRMFT